MNVRVAIVLIAAICGCNNPTPDDAQTKPPPTTDPHELNDVQSAANDTKKTQTDDNVINVNSVRLYLPDEALVSRVGADVQPLADYIQAIQGQTNQYWATHSAGDAKGLLIAIGVKPNGDARACCDALDGDIDDKTLRAFEDQLASVKPLSVKNGPVAFAIEIALGGDSTITFPEMPTEWASAAKNADKPLMVPDELFAEIWPNS